ncbi:MAG: FecR family protein [Myxococcales bacterium]|nr:FecR family protein [Myxococcales bacterium]
MTSPDDARLRQSTLEHTQLDPRTEARLLERLGAQPLASSWRPALAAGALTAALALGSLLLLLALRADRPASVEQVQDMALDLDGDGDVLGTEQHREVEWREGTLTASVAPNKGLSLVVRTEEAQVRVVGTAFEVHRAHHATTVTVQRGSVAVGCVGATQELVLQAGHSRRCLPADLASLLTRFTELTAARAPAQLRLATLDRASRMATDDSAVGGELLAHRATLLAEVDRTVEALANAERYLAEGHEARRDEVLSLTAHVAYDRSGCGAEPVLWRAVEALDPGPEDLLLAGCLADRDPEAARTLVEGAADQVSGAWLQLARTLQERLSDDDQ